MTLRSKLAAFHARIHSHRPSHSHHFHLPGHRDKSSASPGSSPARKPSKFRRKSKSPAKRTSLSSTESNGHDDVARRSSNSSVAPATPLPVLTLILPIHSSSREDSSVEARVYHPSEFPEGYGIDAASPRKAAVVSHPYASLGGNWDDPVVLAIVGLLVARGWVVATFNFCGAGNSKGKTSWTGAPEREEYATVATFLIKYVECLDPNTFTAPSPNTPQTRTKPELPSASASIPRPPIKVLLAGYSYGSLIASRTPSAEKLIKAYSGEYGDVLAYATRTAYEWASTEKRRSFAMARGAGRGKLNPWLHDDNDEEEDSAASEASEGIENAAKTGYAIQETLETSYLLISPLLPPIAMFLNLPNPLSWFQRRKDDSSAGDVGGEEEAEAQTLVMYGTDDMFTGAGRYRNWAKARTEKSAGKFRAVEVEGAGHFWMQDDIWMSKLRHGIATWVDNMNARDTESTASR